MNGTGLAEFLQLLRHPGVAFGHAFRAQQFRVTRALMVEGDVKFPHFIKGIV
jgi:hypothetical protein